VGNLGSGCCGKGIQEELQTPRLKQWDSKCGSIRKSLYSYDHGTPAVVFVLVYCTATRRRGRRPRFGNFSSGNRGTGSSSTAARRVTSRATTTTSPPRCVKVAYLVAALVPLNPHNYIDNNRLNSLLPPHLPLRVHHRLARTTPLPSHRPHKILAPHLRSSARILLFTLPIHFFAIFRNLNPDPDSLLQRTWRGVPPNYTKLFPPLHPRNTPGQHTHTLSLHLDSLIAHHYPRN
jgi:hypothetical protein